MKAYEYQDLFSRIGRKFAKAFFAGVIPNQCDAAAETSTCVLQPVTVAYVETQLSQLKTSKAIGLDNISARLLRDIAEMIAPSLRHIINLSFSTGQFPSSRKCATVAALFKQGDRDDKDNYRPISILPTVGKVIEGAVHTQLYEFLQENNLLATNQFGFRRGRSTTLALTQFTDEVLGNMDKGRVNGVVFIDLKKAFDTVDLQSWSKVRYTWPFLTISPFLPPSPRTMLGQCAQSVPLEATLYGGEGQVWEKEPLLLSNRITMMQCWTTRRQAFLYEQHCMGGGGGR